MRRGFTITSLFLLSSSMALGVGGLPCHRQDLSGSRDRIRKLYPFTINSRKAKVNSGNVLSKSALLGKQALPPRLPGRRPAERAPSSPCCLSPALRLCLRGPPGGGSPLNISPSAPSAPQPHTRYLLTNSHLPKPPSGRCRGSREAHFSIPGGLGNEGCPERCRGTPLSCL